MLSQQPFRLWPFIFVFVLAQIYFVEQFRVSKLKVFKIAFVITWAIYAVGMCTWLSLFGVPALFAFVGIQLLFGYLFFLGIAYLPQRLPIFIEYPIYWVVFELFQARIPFISFSWLTYSTTLISTPFGQFARIGGGALLTFFIVFCSAIAYKLINLFQKKNLSFKFIQQRIFLVTTVVIAGLFLLAPIALTGSKETKLITVIQGNDKNRYLTQEEIDGEYIENSHLDLASKIDFQSDILIFPESAFNDDIEDDNQLKGDLSRVAKKSNSLMIANSIATIDGKDFNRNYFYDNKMKLLGTYDKKRLVPFGEYVPFEKVIGKWAIFDEIGSGFAPGKKDVTIKGVTSLICYESAFSADVTKALNGDSRLLIITTNNRSYQRTGNSVQHRTLTQLRALENGISAVHASVSGSSALIERDGTIVSKSELFERTVISGNLSWGQPDSIYSRTGDWLSLLALLVVIYLYLSNKGKILWKNLTSKN